MPGLAIYDTMQFIKPDVQTICVGVAMSMGALLLSGGAAGKRMALPNSKILIHQVSAGFQGQATDIEIHAKEIIDVRRRLDEIIAQHTGQPFEKVTQRHRARLLHERGGGGGVQHRRPRHRAPLRRLVAPRLRSAARGPRPAGFRPNRRQRWRHRLITATSSRCRARMACGARSANYHAPRNGGRIHEGFDITAACGAELVAVRNGRVLRRGYDPVLYGNYLLIHGEGERRSYFYAHMPRPAACRGASGCGRGSGSAPSAKPATRPAPAATSTSRSTCAASPVDPEPALRRWDRYS